MPEIVLATRNKGKIEEIVHILQFPQMHFKSIADYSAIPETNEDGDTLEHNALKKAREAFYATGIPSVADDSGLEVYALDMRPGVYSARYAGEKVTYAQNNEKLLHELKNIPSSERLAQFRCVASFVSHEVEKTFEGICRGRILNELRGKGGFGYDPLFVPDGYSQTFAELSIEIKNRISHRAKAFLALRDFLHAYYSLP